MFVYRKQSDQNSDMPQVCGPRWASLEDAPEEVRPLLVEVEEPLRWTAVERLPDRVEVEARVGELYGVYLRVRATKETFWDAVREAIAQDHMVSALRGGLIVAVPALYTQVSITEVRGEGWTWNFGDGVSVDPSYYACIQASMVSVDDEDDLDLAATVMATLRDFKACYKP